MRVEVAALAEYLKTNNPEIIKIIWFGSWAAGTFSPGSDVDLCIVVVHTEKAPRDRAVEYLPHRFPVGLDICVYTEKEFGDLAQSHPEWYSAIASGENI